MLELYQPLYPTFTHRDDRNKNPRGFPEPPFATTCNHSGVDVYDTHIVNDWDMENSHIGVTGPATIANSHFVY